MKSGQLLVDTVIAVMLGTVTLAALSQFDVVYRGNLFYQLLLWLAPMACYAEAVRHCRGHRRHTVRMIGIAVILGLTALTLTLRRVGSHRPHRFDVTWIMPAALPGLEHPPVLAGTQSGETAE